MTRTVCGLLAILLGAGVAAGQNRPDDLVKRAVEAHGGLAALKKYPAGTSRIGGKVIIEGKEFPFTGSLAFMIPGKVRMEMTVEAAGQKATLLQVVNGDKVRQTENGVPSKLDAAMQAELRESAVIQEMSLLYPLLDAGRYTLVADKDATIDGREAAAVVVKAQGLKDTRLFFDKKTGLLVGMQRQGLSPTQRKVDELTTFSDYKTVGGMVVPMTSKVSHDGKPFLEIGVTDYKPLEAVEAKFFTVE
jgi:hypothetical protein